MNSARTFGPDFKIPVPINLTLHLSPFVTLAIHFFLTERRYSSRATRVWAPVSVAAFALWYSCFQEWCAAKNGFCELSLLGQL